ncbi:DUF1799 domain-containing protein [Marivibrio halodurans]|uniref:DUF1799 domain-containing protein n=1 Tax=Marivibrio halodurans TaxID=2039722 RepID=UPI00360911DA
MRAAAGAWAGARQGGGGGPDLAVEDLIAFGLDPVDAERIGRIEDVDDDAVEIWPEHEAVVRLFLALSTQWRVGGMAGAPLGIDYASIETTGRLLGIEVTPAVFEDLRVMEAEARDVLLRRIEEAANR